MIDYILNFPLNGRLGLLLFWLPLVFCSVGYTIGTFGDYQKDKADRDNDGFKHSFYVPKLTVGTLIGRFIVTVVPIANIFAGVFDVAPELFGTFFNWCGRVLDIPLVPKRPK